ncbi:MAG: ATP-binding protein, partial [Clostridiales bacterium 43-6]
MRELSLNILDITQNSISAGASVVEISILQSEEKDLLEIAITDNGKGMTAEQIIQVTDPFYTTRKTRKVGLGIPLFKMAAEMSGGNFSITSTPGVGTKIVAGFQNSHIDRMPMGDMNSTIGSLIYLNPGIDFIYRESVNEAEFILDTRELRTELGEVPLNAPEVTGWIKEYFTE